MSVLDGPGEGTWSVFAAKVVAERDEARAEVERLRALLAEARVALQGVAAYDASPDVSWTLTKEFCRDAIDRIDAAQRERDEARAQLAAAEASINAVRAILDEGTDGCDCDCDCDHDAENHESDCANCLTWRISLAIDGTRDRDALKEKP